jgi:hypothetical protein
LFLMYQGALTMFLSTLFWNLCIMSILLCLVQPHNWILYVQTGFKICSYKRSLLWKDSEEVLPISQYIFLYLRSGQNMRNFLKIYGINNKQKLLCNLQCVQYVMPYVSCIVGRITVT